jgi:uncharacterized protein
MNDMTPIKTTAQLFGFGIYDCDIHPLMRSNADMLPYLSTKWRTYLADYGLNVRKPYISTVPYPRITPLIARRDAWPPAGGQPGSDLAFMREQHLDAHGIEFATLQTLFPDGYADRNLEFSAAVCRAVNHWQVDTWCDPEPRLKGSIVVPMEDTAAAVAEIEYWAGNPRFVQINIPPRCIEPVGRRRYWPVYEAATRTGLRVAAHISGYGGFPLSASGWPSYYAEEHQTNAHVMQNFLTSLLLEGVFEAFPDMKLLVVEGGIGWIPSLAWRLDAQWKRFRGEVPHLKRPPSEYIRDNVWFTTQPIDEPERSVDLRTTINWIGWDKLLFSTDYPHWDSDDPRYVFKFPLSAAERRMVFRDNARSFYGLN